MASTPRDSSRKIYHPNKLLGTCKRTTLFARVFPLAPAYREKFRLKMFFWKILWKKDKFSHTFSGIEDECTLNLAPGYESSVRTTSQHGQDSVWLNREQQ